MELPRFLTLSKSRRFLTLSKSSKTDHVVPQLRDVNLKASVHISDATLLEYQHDLSTNSTFFNINLRLDPSTAEVSAFQQFFIVNGLCDEFMLELDYDNSIIADASNNREKQQRLVEHAENICNQKISRELEIAEKLLDTEVAGFLSCVESKVDSLLDANIEPEVIEAGLVPLVEKSSHVYLEWFSLIETCINELVVKARIDSNEFPIENPFELIDLAKVRTLGSLFGEIYEGHAPWVRYPLQTRKYHTGSVLVCRSHRISAERIKTCAAHCAASFFTTLSKSPIGRRFENATAELQQKYIARTRSSYKTVEALARQEKAESLEKIREHAELLAKELGPEAERLKLAMEHDIDLLPIFYETLTGHIRGEIEAALNRGLAVLYPSGEIDLSSAIGSVNGDLSRLGKPGRVSSPNLLTLRVSHIVNEFFSEHAWLPRLGIRKPEIKMLATGSADTLAGGADSAHEFVLIDDYIESLTPPPNAGILIDTDKIALGTNREEEIIKLHRI